MSSIHTGGVGHPGVPGPEAEIRRLKRRVVELEATCARANERNQALEAQASDVMAAEARVATLTQERDEAKATAETERKRAEHFAEEYAASVRELEALRRSKGGRK